MKIHVTEEDIKKGERTSCGSCPIALALLRAGFKGVSVFAGAVVTARGGRIAPLPTRAFRFMMRFDKGRPVKPFAFLLAASPDCKTVTP